MLKYMYNAFWGTKFNNMKLWWEGLQIAERTGYSFELVEFILWQRYCYEMENDYWTYDREKCNKCGSSELYLKEVPNVDFADQVICKKCGTEFRRN